MLPQLNIAICEDSLEDTSQLLACIHKCGRNTQLGTYTNSESFLRDYYKGKYHLAFLDIYMDGMAGDELAARVREVDSSVVLAFTTTSISHYAVGYQYNVYKYIQKPVVQQEVLATIELAEALYEKRSRETLRISTRQGTKATIFFDDIRYIEWRDRMCQIHTADTVVLAATSLTLEQLANLLPGDRFYRCHRAFVANFDWVHYFDGRDFVMRGGEKIYVRHTRPGQRNAALDAYNAHLLAKANTPLQGA